MEEKKKGKTNRKPTPEPGTLEEPLRAFSSNRASLETGGSISAFLVVPNTPRYPLRLLLLRRPRLRLLLLLLLLLHPPGARTCLREKREIATAKHSCRDSTSRDVNILLLVPDHVEEIFTDPPAAHRYRVHTQTSC